MAGTQRPRTFLAAEIRDKRFSQRLRGFDVHEVDAFLDRIADQMAALEQMVEELGRENAELRARSGDTDKVTHQAVMLFSQAQQVADTLIEEAVKRARKMLSEAQARQRENV
jgi:DivIVA domain-containing protein